MYSKSCLITLSVLSCVLAVLSAAVDQSQLPSKSELVVEKQVDGQQPAVPVDVNAVSEQCHQPKETGRCFALFYRFAYNLDTQSCEEFIYGGCAGNSNNFDTKEQCEQVCLSKVAPTTAPSAAESATESATELTTEQQQLESNSSSSQATKV
ncbi:kunitz-type U19-barytoxin-Tl1a [Drosophila albomicans]|uniref:Kunitz-type U19-barytoxin-Tl1a n=1 Tax=Drosophila albomicans TaxID=7291 RepID=A0A9C6SL42_DROAB|nr:kunitz-type U19-barytoxin-Tl1a [Drosophila albomicans]